ncbi:hypothetical protein [Psychromicrobium sp. YIM B11713]|uniref:hypothetical protein n=1 Tax=Psychromicrobium sp. YIM B11713 TaxID=3145233 RepID=UPI00374F3407
MPLTWAEVETWIDPDVEPLGVAANAAPIDVDVLIVLVVGVDRVVDDANPPRCTLLFCDGPVVLSSALTEGIALCGGDAAFAAEQMMLSVSASLVALGAGHGSIAFA